MENPSYHDVAVFVDGADFRIEVRGLVVCSNAGSEPPAAAPPPSEAPAPAQE